MFSEIRRVSLEKIKHEILVKKIFIKIGALEV